MKTCKEGCAGSQWNKQTNNQSTNQTNKQTNMFTGTWLPLLRIPFSADHSMDIKKNTFCGARTLVSPNLVHKRRQKSMSKMTLPWKGVSLIWKGPIAYLVFHNFHQFPETTCPSLIILIYLVLPEFLRWLIVAVVKFCCQNPNRLWLYNVIYIYI